jgi:hypothetical protein
MPERVFAGGVGTDWSAKPDTVLFAAGEPPASGRGKTADFAEGQWDDRKIRDRKMRREVGSSWY